MSSKYYGFDIPLNTTVRQKLDNVLLYASAPVLIYEDDRAIDVVEEVIRRNGTLFTGEEAKTIVPWTIDDPEHCFFAKFDYLPEETERPKSKWYKDNDWVFLNDIQYLYAKYLQKGIEMGLIKREDIIDRRPGRKRLY